MPRTGPPWARPAAAGAFLVITLLLSTPPGSLAGVIQSPETEAVGAGSRPESQQPDPLLATGRRLVQVAICKGKGGSEILDCKVSGTGSPPVSVRTDYFQFVAAGWNLTQVVSDYDSKLLIYFFEHQRSKR